MSSNARRIRHSSFRRVPAHSTCPEWASTVLYKRRLSLYMCTMLKHEKVDSATVTSLSNKRPEYCHTWLLSPFCFFIAVSLSLPLCAKHGCVQLHDTWLPSSNRMAPSCSCVGKNWGSNALITRDYVAIGFSRTHFSEKAMGIGEVRVIVWHHLMQVLHDVYGVYKASALPS